ncbi:MAG: LLM class flavin-dependent oxidoreductase [Actinomycetota bacterium]
MEIGLYNFGDSMPDAATGATIDQGTRIRNLLEEIEVADAAGLDVIALGEHHRPEFAVSSPSTVLAAAATRTERIRLSSGVTVLGSEDPIRVYQQFATIDQISRGRAEIMAGRGSFLESFPLFGQDLAQYDEIFAEKLDLLLNVRDNLVVHHEGVHRPSIDGRAVYPRAYQDLLPVWLAIGGTPQSAVRAAALKLPLALAIIGGEFGHFEPMTRLYRQAWEEFGHDPADLLLGINAHGFVGETTREAQDLVYPTYQAMMNQIGRERGWQPRGREHYDHECRPGGALLIGSVDDVVEKLLAYHAVFGNTRFLLKTSASPLEHEATLRSIELLGKEVAPRVRAEVARREAAAATA